ncbi:MULTISPECIES: DUF2062 domain-containing protein [unclassified Moorena]|uniref:DUF2062 domain-containing protein n=1 Tax=unclassified Moorena TaxID=2683338 RepID=UPI0025DD3CD2|nr:MULTISPECIES: DUF2062 domain-containing protein [unclassified Moorena]
MSRKSLSSYPQPLPSATKPLDLGKRKSIRPRGTFRRRLKYIYWRLVRMQGKPEAIARGLACGVFAGFFPLFGLQLIIGILLAVLLRGNKIAATAGTWISNPLTYVPIFAFNFHVGEWLLNQDELANVSFQSWQEFRELGSEIVLTLFVGCFAVGLVCAVVSYWLSVKLIYRLRTSRALKCQKKRCSVREAVPKEQGTASRTHRIDHYSANS